MSRKVSVRKQREARLFVDEILTKLEEVSKREFGRTVPHPKMRISFHPRFKTSCAGEADIFLALHSSMFHKVFQEYDHIRHDPEIGDLRTTHWKQQVAVILVHEYAHLIDYSFQPKLPKGYKAYSDKGLPADAWGHGAEWQYIYRVLRTKILSEIRV